MLCIKVVLIGAVLYSAGVTYTGEDGIYCSHLYESAHGKQIPATYCWFNKLHRERDFITPVISASEEKLYFDLDNVDKIIFNGKNVAAYSYQTIMKATDINVYVLKAEYEPYCTRVLSALKIKHINLINALEEYKDGKRTLENQEAGLIKQVVVRIKKYVSFLETSTQYSHPCVGLIVPKRAVYCIRLAYNRPITALFIQD